MRKLMLLAFLCFSIPAFSQDPNKPTRSAVAGMFTYVHSSDSGVSTDFVGGDVSYTGNLTKYFALEADFSANYWLAPINIVDAHYYTIGAGPKFTFPSGRITPYIHVLSGLARGTGGFLGVKLSENDLFLSPGFGVDVSVSRHFGIRAIQFDYVTMYSSNQKRWETGTFRVGGGFVAKF